MADVIIAGGGVIGLYAGWRLAERKLHVVLVDSGAPPATNAAAGLLTPSSEPTLSGAALAMLGRESLNRWSQEAPFLEERSGISIDFERRGVLSAAFAEEEAENLAGAPERGPWLDAPEARALEPALSPTLRGARFAADEGQVDPRRLKRALEEAFQRAGGAILRGKRLVRLLSASGEMTGAELHDGKRLAACVAILATGAALPPRFAEKDVAKRLSGAIFPIKGEALALAKGGRAPSRVIRTRRAYLCPKADGRVVVGATEIAGDRSLNADAGRIAALRSAAAEACPALAAAPEIERWAGLRPATLDGAPILGRAPEGPRGLILALGHYRNGILLAPATAHLLVRLIADGVEDPVLAAFSAARFNNLGVS